MTSTTPSPAAHPVLRAAADKVVARVDGDREGARGSIPVLDPSDGTLINRVADFDTELALPCTTSRRFS